GASFAWWWGRPGIMARNDVRSLCANAAELLVGSVGGKLIDVAVEFPSDPNHLFDVLTAVDRVNSLSARSREINIEEISPYFRKRIEKARAVSIEQLASAHSVRKNIEAITDKVLEKVDFVLAPTTTITAFCA